MCVLCFFAVCSPGSDGSICTAQTGILNTRTKGNIQGGGNNIFQMVSLMYTVTKLCKLLSCLNK